MLVYGRHGGLEAKLLASCYKNSLMLATQHSLGSIAFPAISTGVYGYPHSEVAAVASEAIKEFLAGDELVKAVRLVFFRPDDGEVFLGSQKFS